MVHAISKLFCHSHTLVGNVLLSHTGGGGGGGGATTYDLCDVPPAALPNIAPTESSNTACPLAIFCHQKAHQSVLIRGSQPFCTKRTALCCGFQHGPWKSSCSVRSEAQRLACDGWRQAPSTGSSPRWRGQPTTWQRQRQGQGRRRCRSCSSGLVVCGSCCITRWSKRQREEGQARWRQW